jgi:hypothetical protein
MRYTEASSEPDAPRADGRLGVAVLGVTLLLLAVSACYRAGQADFYRGLKTDELITLQNYTWAGVNGDGTRHELARLTDIDGLPRPSSRELLIGLYCSLGRWPEPNNHVMHSLLLNATLATMHQRDLALRLPALLAAVAYAFALAIVCWHCRWYAMCPLIGVLTFWLPYVVTYSQEARGYTLMLLLVVLFLIACELVTRNPTSILFGSCLVLLSVFTFQNLVNMVVDWVIPCFVLLTVAPSLFVPSPTTEQTKLRRRSLLIQFLCIGLVGFVFFMDRLPYVYSSSQQYGLVFRKISEFVDLFWASLRFLFPAASLAVLALLGVAGLGLAWRERPGRGYVALSTVAVLATLVHFAASRRFAYERNLGFWLVPVLIGYACLGQRLIAWPRTGGRRVAVGVFVYIGTLTCLVMGLQTPVTDASYEVFRTRIHELPEQSEIPSLALLGSGVPEPIRLDFPKRWSEAVVSAEPGEHADLLLVEKFIPLPLWTARRAGAVPDWPGAELLVQEGWYSILRLPCIVVRPGTNSSTGIVLWYPSFEAVAVSPDNVLRYLNERKLVYHSISTRYQTKLEVFGRLTVVVAAGVTPDQTQEVLAACREGQRRFGGSIIVLSPRER